MVLVSLKIIFSVQTLFLLSRQGSLRQNHAINDIKIV